MLNKNVTIVKRLEAKIIKKLNGCWEWTGALSKQGYGMIEINYKERPARRVSYEIFKKTIPPRECLISICKNKLCINPHHLQDRMEVLFSNIKKNEITQCWEWQRNLNNKGYAVFSMKCKMMLVHRILFEHFKEKIPKKMEVCHKCDNPKCVNPDHLFLGTHRDNMKDMENKKRDIKSKGNKHFRSKINEKIAYDIKIKFNSGIPVKEIYKLLKISYATVWQICKNKTWNHVII